MNSKRIISLILSIIMTLQVFVFQTPVHAMEGVNPTSQKSEGQKIGKRSEIFEFKNNEKPKLSWFSPKSRSLFGARDVGLTKSEKVKIETALKGLDEGKKEFNWEAFGQNKKFQAWVEVAYKDEKDDQGDPIRHKVSEDFEINKAGTIDTNITVDASKTVENYFIVTEYDKEPDSFKINAFFDKTTIKSDKGEKSIAFKLDVHQIVSTKITYNLIDEYGKAIDLKDAKAEKPEDNDLKGIGKIGDDISFDLKKEGTENLWQEEMQKDEPNFDESDLTSSSLALSLTKNQVTSGGIDYKLSSTYDNINGGTVTIKRQKDVVTPKDQHNPGATPDGYARINLVADETGNGSRGTFTKGDATDSTRVVDVKAGKAYTVAQDAIDKLGKPLALRSDNTVNNDQTFSAWTPALNTLGTAAVGETKTLNASYKQSDQEIIPYLPGEPVPTKDKDGLQIPSTYVTVTFKSESETKGKVKIGDKVGATVLAKVKPGIDLSQKTEITTVPAEHYGFTQWKPVLGKAADGKTYTAYFVKSGEEIGKNDPIPNGWYRVTVSQDAASIQANTVDTKYYPVKPGDKLAEDKFPAIAGRANEGYKDPAWYVGSDKVEKPYEVVINSSVDFIARATELESHKITIGEGIKPVDISAFKGDETGGKFWNKGVALNKDNESLQKILNAATVTDITDPGRTTAEEGTFTGTLKVLFSDGSELTVTNQKLIVKDTKVGINFDIEIGDGGNLPRHKEEVVKGKIVPQEKKETIKLDGALVTVKVDGKVIGRTLANEDGSFIVGTRPLVAGEVLDIVVTLPEVGRESSPVQQKVQLNPDELNKILPVGDKLYGNLKDKPEVNKEKLDALNTAVEEGYKLVDKAANGQKQIDQKVKSTVSVDATGQGKLDTAYENIKKAIEDLTENKAPVVTGPAYKEIFKGDDIDLDQDIKVTDDNIKKIKNKDYSYEIFNARGKKTTLNAMKAAAGVYRVVYTAEDTQGVKGTHVMTVLVKEPVIEVPGEFPNPIPNGYVKVEFKEGAHGKLQGTTKFLVKEGAESNTINPPTIVPNKLWKASDKNWNPEIPATFTPADANDKSFTFTAQYTYTGKDSEPQKPNENKPDVPDNFVKVEFKKGDHGIISSEEATIYWVDPTKSVKFTPPVVTPNTNYSHKGWKICEKDVDPAVEATYAKETEIVAQYKETVVTKDPKDQTNYAKVEFVAGTNGIFEQANGADQITTFWVLKGEKASFNAPTVTPNENFKFKAWSPEIQEKYTENQTHTAQYEATSNVSDTKVDGFQEVKFLAGDDGHFGNDVKEKSLWVRPDTLVDLRAKAPTVTVTTAGKSFIGWNQDLVQTFAKSDKPTEIKAKYDDTVKTTEPTGKDKEKYAKVDFIAGNLGKIENNQTTTFWVVKGEKVTAEFKAPTVTPVKDWKQKDANLAWSPQVADKYDKDTIHVAQYEFKGDGLVEQKPGEPKPNVPENFVKIEFKRGANGVISSEETFIYWADPAKEYTLKAPAVIADKGYKHTGWSPEIQANHKYTEKTEFTAQYKANVVTEDPNDTTNYAKISFTTDGNGSLEGTKEFWVLKGEKVSFNAPKVTANENYKFKAWDKPLQETYNEDTTHKATFESTLNVSDKEVAGYYKLTFKAGDHGTLTEKSVWIKPNTLVDLTDKAPEVTANTGYSHIGWKPGLVGTFSKDTDLVAQYTNSASDTYVDGWIEITFDQGDHGKLETNAKNVKWVDPKADIKLGDIAPRLKADPNWTFKTWNDGTENGNVDLQTAKKYVKPVAYKAHYETTVLSKEDYDKLTEDEKKNFLEITFDAGDHGKFAEDPVKPVYVKKNTEVDLRDKAPIVIADRGYGHTGWDTDLVGTFAKATTITAKYQEGQFDENKTAEIIVLGPTKMGYGVGEKLDLAGLKVLAIDKSGIQKTYDGLDAITKAGFTIKPENGKVLAMSDDGKAIVVTKGQDPDKLESKTTTTLKIHENKSQKAEDVKALNQNQVGPDGKPTDKAKDTTTVTGKAPAGSTVIIKNEAGDQIGKVEKVGDDGTFTAEVTKQEDGKKVQVIVKEEGKQDSNPAEATVATDSNNDGTADKDADQKTKTPTAKALNQGANPEYTTITGKAEPGAKVVAKVVAKVGEEVVGEAIADKTTGDYKIEAKQNEKPLSKDTEVKVTAQADKKLVSDQAATIVRIDKDSNGKADNEEDFDIAKAAKIEVLSDPDKMDYLVASENGAVKFEANGLLVKVTDTAGNSKVYNAEDLAKDKTNFTVAPANDELINIANYNNQKVKVTLNNAPDGMNPKSAETSKVLSIKVDADGNGVADDQEKFDIKKATKVEIIKNPDKMDYLVKDKDGKAKFETKGLVVKFTDDSGKSATYKAEDLANMSDVKISPANNEEIGLTAEGKTNTLPLEVTVNGKTNDVKPNITVKLDADGNGSADETETTPDPKVTARNVGENPTKTTVDVKTEPNAKVTIEYTDANNETKTIDATADGDGKVSKEIDPKLKAGTEVKVTVQDGEKKPAAKTANVFNDLDGDGVNNEDEQTPMPSILSAKNVKDGQEVKTVVKVKGVKGATITIKSEDGNTILGTGLVGDNGEVEIKLDPKQEAGTRVKAIAKLGERKDSEAAESIVFDDLDNDGKPDGQGKIDLGKITQMRIASDPKNMKYALKSDTDTADLKLDGLTVYVKDENGNSAIYQYGAAANKVNDITFEELKGNANFKLELVDGSGANPADITDTTKLAKANDANKIKVSLVKNADQADTTGPLNVFVDANGNGIDDSKENIDLTKATKIEVISQPELNYPITDKNGKANLDLSKMVVVVSDGVTTANYKASELLESDKFKLSLVDGDTEKAVITKLNGTELKIENDGNKVKVELAAKPDVNSKTDPLQVFEDLDKDGKRDANQTVAPKDIKALNVKDEKFTTITGKANPGDTIKVYDQNGKELVIVPADAKADQNGDFKVTVSDGDKALPENITVYVSAKADGKDESKKMPATVKADKDGDGIADTDQDFDIAKAAKIEMLRDPNKMDYLVNSKDGKVKFQAYGMIVRITDTAGKQRIYTSEEMELDKTNFKVEPANGSDLTVKDNGKTVVKVTLPNAPTEMATKEVETSRAISVKIDADGNGIADEDQNFDITKTKTIKVIEDPTVMAYEVDSKDGQTLFNTAGLVVELTDSTGKTAKYTANELKNMKDKITIDPADGKNIGLDKNDQKVKVTVTAAAGEEKPTAESTNAIKVEIKAPEAPVVDPIKAGDDKVVVKEPQVGNQVTITLPGGKQVIVTKGDNNKWTAPNGDNVPVDNGKLNIPVDKVTEGQVKVEVKDNDSGKTAETIVEVQKTIVEKKAIKITIVNADKNNQSIVLNTNPGRINVTVSVESGSKTTEYTVTTSFFGIATVYLDKPLTSGDLVTITSTMNSSSGNSNYIDSTVYREIN